MKLLFCLDCHDLFNLQVNVKKTCSCGKVSGMYTDPVNAIYTGGIPVGINSIDFLQKIKQQVIHDSEITKPYPHEGFRFEAFAIPQLSTVNSMTFVDNIE